MKRSSRVSIVPILISVLALSIIGGGLFYWYAQKQGSNEGNVLTVSKGDFLRQVSISGRVIAAEDVDLSFVHGGRVAKVLVAVSSEAKKGDVLAEVANDDFKANYDQKVAMLETEQAALRALRNGARPEDVAVTESGVQTSKTSLYQARQTLIEAMYDAYSSTEDAIRTKVDLFIINPRSNSPQLSFSSSDSQLEDIVESKRIEIEQVLNEWKAFLPLLSPDVDPATSIAKIQGYLGTASSFLGTVNLLLNQGVPNGSMTQAILSGYASGVAIARDTVNGSLTAVTLAITAEKAAVSALRTAEKNLTLKSAGPVQADIDAQIARIKAARAIVDDAKAQLEKTRIIAPFDGVVTVIDAKVGAIAQANTPQISMISKGAYLIESFIPEINISLVKLDDIADVTLDAYGDQVKFATKVVSIDPVETVRDGVSTYKAMLKFLAVDPRVKVGMTANVTVTTDKKSNVISIPQKIVILRDGKKFVTILDGNKSIEREVTVGGISSLGTIEILSGLVEGDRVVIPSP